MNILLRPRVSSAPTTCVVCRDTLGQIEVCRACRTTTHPECSVGRTGCPTIGCYGRDQLTLADLWALDPERAPRPETSLDSQLSAAWAFAVVGGAFGAFVGLLLLVVLFVEWVVS